MGFICSMPKADIDHNTTPGFEITNVAQVAQINIVGEIGWWKTSGERFIQLVDELLASGVEDVHGYISSGGGSMDDANEIGNQIQRFPGSKSCKLGSMCASAATTVACHFDHDKITASANTQYMIHDPVMRTIIARLKDFESAKKLYENLRNDAISNYVKVTKSNKGDKGLSAEKVDEMMESVTWMNAEEAKAKGFVSNVDGEEDAMVPEDTQNVLEKLYQSLNEQKAGNYAIPEVVNSLFSEEQEEADTTDDTENSNENSDMDKDTFLKNKLIVAFALTSVTEASTVDDVVNAALQRNKEAVEMMNAVAKACGVTLQSTDGKDAVVQAFADMIKAKDDKISELENASKEDDKKKIKALLDIAQQEGRFLDDGRKKLEKMGANMGIKALMDLVETMPKREKLSDKLDEDYEGASGDSLSSAVYARIARLEAEQNKS